MLFWEAAGAGVETCSGAELLAMGRLFWGLASSMALLMVSLWLINGYLMASLMVSLWLINGYFMAINED